MLYETWTVSEEGTAIKYLVSLDLWLHRRMSKIPWTMEMCIRNVVKKVRDKGISQTSERDSHYCLATL